MNLMCVGREIAFARGYKLENSPFCTYFETQVLISVGRKRADTQACARASRIWDPLERCTSL